MRRPEQRPVPEKLPDDPAVFQGLGIRPEPFNDQDAIVIRRQMGHRPRLALGVVRRCRYGYPQVLIFAPLQVAGDHVSPNSTLCWLSCPLLVQEMDRLEKQGEIERFEHLASADEELRSSIEEAHRATARIRKALVPEDWLKRLESERPRDFWIVAQTGISGITRPEHVKCLHAHLADYLARGTNPVGYEVARLLESQGTPVEGTETCWRLCTPEGASERIAEE
ncbi:MAG: DUF501 domain-containing protein [Bacillota bacterium]